MNGPGSRPRTVRAAAALLVLQAILAGAAALLDGATFAGLPAVLLVVVAAFLLRDGDPTRTAAWLFSGLGVLGFAAGTVLGAPTRAGVISTAGSVLVLLAYVTVSVLTVRPPRRASRPRRT